MNSQNKSTSSLGKKSWRSIAWLALIGTISLWVHKLIQTSNPVDTTRTVDGILDNSSRKVVPKIQNTQETQQIPNTVSAQNPSLGYQVTGDQVFYNGHLMEWVDILSFKVHEECQEVLHNALEKDNYAARWAVIAEDKNRVYSYGLPLSLYTNTMGGASVFEQLGTMDKPVPICPNWNESGFYKLGGKVIDTNGNIQAAQDINTYRPLAVNGEMAWFWKDILGVYNFLGEKIEGTDLDSFDAIGEGFAKDRNYVYGTLWEKLSDKPQKFRLLKDTEGNNSCFGTDGNKVYTNIGTIDIPLEGSIVYHDEVKGGSCISNNMTTFSCEWFKCS